MNRRLTWNSAQLDEIELVYEKAEKDEAIGAQLEKLEEQALAEAKANVGLLKPRQGPPMTPDRFDALSENDKETVITVLGNAGLSGLNTDMGSATITIRLSALLPRVQACTIFAILNRLEKLDGAVNIIAPKWTLELQTPLGGKKGLFQWEMLIMRLYPWLSVSETSTNEVAVTLDEQAAVRSEEDPAAVQSEKGPAAEQKAEAQPEKKPFWKKLFGKR